MGPLEVDVRQLAVMPRHLQAGMAQEPLEAEDVTSVAQKSYRRRVPQRVWRDPDPFQARLSAVGCHSVPYPILGEGSAVRG